MATKLEHFQAWSLQFLEYYLTFIYGVLGVLYIIYLEIKTRFTQNKLKAPESTTVKATVPPKLLSHPEFGHHKFIKLQDVKLHYVESGSTEDPLLLLIHGCPDFWFTWMKQIPFLSKNFWVIAVDLRGCGDSDKPAYRRRYTDNIIAKDIADFITAIGGKRAHIIVSGTSGQAIWRMAYMYPNLIHKLVFIQAPHPFTIKKYIQTRKKYFLLNLWYLHLSLWPFVPEWLIETQSSKITADFLKHLTNSKELTEEEIECYKYNYMWRDDWMGALNYIRNLDIRSIWSSNLLEPEVLTIPTMMIMGDKDTYLPLDVAYRTAEYVERIQVRPIHSSNGRWVHVTNSKEVNVLLNKFLVDKPKVVLQKQSKSDAGPSLMGRMMGAGFAAVSNTVTRTTSAVELTKNIPSGFVGVAQSTARKMWLST